MKNLIARNVRYNARKVCQIFDHFDIWDDIESRTSDEDMDEFMSFVNMTDERIDAVPIAMAIKNWITIVPEILIYRTVCGFIALVEGR